MSALDRWRVRSDFRRFKGTATWFDWLFYEARNVWLRWSR